uniref:Phosphoenolpyruvate carboxylase housekeeping isozyme n=1 Tax=Rhizophora mucronata TaxID=61149 RepID=A0A2P2PP13_RHIMU
MKGSMIPRNWRSLEMF